MSTFAVPAAPARITKRKLDEVISALDDAVNPTAERPTPPKRVQTRPPSLYSSLSKLGFSKFDSQSDLTDGPYELNHRPRSAVFSSLLSRSRFWDSQPDLTSDADAPVPKRARFSTILSQASSRSRLLKPRPKLPSLPSGSGSPDPLLNASPSSLQGFLARLATFTRTSYSTQPDALDPAHAAACGWHCPTPSQFAAVSVPGTPRTTEGESDRQSMTGADRLACAICKATWTVAQTRGMTRDAAHTLTERQAKMLVEKHKDLCPWRRNQCSLSIYRVPLKTPLQTARDVVAAAKAMDDAMCSIEVAHPLMPDQLKRALHILKNAPMTDSAHEANSEGAPEEARPSSAALLAGLFGWELAPTPPPPPPRRVSSSFSSWSRASSPAPTTPTTPKKRSDAVLQCSLCQRRVGLWTQRPLNVLREHRVYCPYVARTAALPVLPASSSSAGSTTSSLVPDTLVEGWRARVGVLLRYSLGLRGRGREPGAVDADGADAAAEDENMERVQGMVRAVKAAAAGGGDVRKYVRGLLDPHKSGTT